MRFHIKWVGVTQAENCLEDRAIVKRVANNLSYNAEVRSKSDVVSKLWPRHVEHIKLAWGPYFYSETAAYGAKCEALSLWKLSACLEENCDI